MYSLLVSWTQFKDDWSDKPSIFFSFGGFLQSLLKEQILTNYKFSHHIVLSFFQNHSRLISMRSVLYKSTEVKHINEAWCRISLSKFSMVIRGQSGKKNRTTASKEQMPCSEVGRSQKMRSRFKTKLVDEIRWCFDTIRTSFSIIYIKPENVLVSRIKHLCVRLCCAMILTISAFFCNVSVTVALLVRTKTDLVSRIGFTKWTLLKIKSCEPDAWLDTVCNNNKLKGIRVA